jgi:hypothetical protein
LPATFWLTLAYLTLCRQACIKSLALFSASKERMFSLKIIRRALVIPEKAKNDGDGKGVNSVGELNFL